MVQTRSWKSNINFIIENTRLYSIADPLAFPSLLSPRHSKCSYTPYTPNTPYTPWAQDKSTQRSVRELNKLLLHALPFAKVSIEFDVQVTVHREKFL